MFQLTTTIEAAADSGRPATSTGGPTLSHQRSSIVRSPGGASESHSTRAASPRQESGCAGCLVCCAGSCAASVPAPHSSSVTTMRGATPQARAHNWAMRVRQSRRVAGGMLIVAAFIMAEMASPVGAPARAQAAPAAAAREFEVVSIKPNQKAAGPMGAIELVARRLPFRPVNGRVRMTATTVSLLVQVAYNVKDFQVVGAPEWIAHRAVRHRRDRRLTAPPSNRRA